MNNAPLNYDVIRKERGNITIDGNSYVLVELNGKERDKYLNNLAARIRTTGSGKGASQSVKNFDGLQAALLTASLYRVEGDSRVRVSVAEVQEWPARIISDLFQAAKELSRIDEDAEDEDEDESGGEEGNDD